MQPWLRSAARVAAVVCMAALLLSFLPAVTAAGAHGSTAKDAGDWVFLVFKRECLEGFLKGDLFNIPCLKATVSKCLGYAIITGACIVKLPQILNFIRNRSVAGMSRMAAYTELIGYLLQSVYHIKAGSPFSAYGETVIVTAQSIMIVLLMWAMDFPGTAHAAGVAVALAAVTQATLMADPAHLVYVQSIVTVFFIVSRATQILAIARQGGTGTLAFLTLFMNFAGSAARIFTSSVEVKDKPEVLVSFAISTLLNGVLLGQYAYYNWGPGRKTAVAAAKAKKVDSHDDAAGASSSGGGRRRAAAAAKQPKMEEQPAEPVEADAPSSSGGARKRSAARRQQA